MSDLLDDVVTAAGLTVFGAVTAARPAQVPAPVPGLPGAELAGRIAALRAELRAQGTDRVLLCAGGAPAAGARAIAATLGLPLTVLSTADPHRLGAVLAGPPERTVVVLSAPAPQTVLDAHRRLLTQAFDNAGPHRTGRRFVVVTEPGSALASFAEQIGAHLFLAAASASALSAYALVPAGLAGADTAALLAEAAALADPGPPPPPRLAAGFAVPSPQPAPDRPDPAVPAVPAAPGVALGEAIAAAVRGGRDKLAVAPDGTGIDGLAPWIETLFGDALVTVALENPSSWGHEGPDVLGVTVGGALGRAILPGGGISPDLSVNGPLGAQLFAWEQAALVAGARPLPAPGDDEPAPPPSGTPAFVEGAVEVYGRTSATTLVGAVDELARAVPPGGRVAIEAHLDPGGDARAAEVRDVLGGRVARAVTFGWGPRRAPGTGATLVITGAVREDVPVPGRPYTFGELQAAGAAAARHEPALRLHLTDRATGVEQLLAALGG